MTRRRVLLCTAWVTVLGCTAFVSTSVAASPSPGPATCGQASSPARSAERGNTATLPVIATDEDDAFFLRFDDSRRPRALSVVLSAFPEVTRNTKLNVRLGSGYLRSGERNIIAARDDGLLATFAVPDPNHIEVCLTVNPTGVADLRPGRYTGSIVVGGGVQEVSLPVELTFRASRWDGLLAAFIGVFLGLLVKVLSEAAAGQAAKPTGAREALLAYVKQLSFPVTLILGLIAGWVGFVQVYGVDASWGSGGLADATKLFALCFIAQMSSIEAIEIIKRVAGGASVGHPATGTS